VARYFSDEQSHIDKLQAEQDVLTQELESFVEENAGDEGLLVDALTDNGKVTKASVAARLKLAADKEEIVALKKVKQFIDQESTAKRVVKAAHEALVQQVLDKYPTLDISEIKTLVVEDKWHGMLHANIASEIERVTQQLANRVKTLEERYAEPLSRLKENVSELSVKVDEHLKAMGLSWQTSKA
jgi:type I restriction enzyme M protein